MKFQNECLEWIPLLSPRFTLTILLPDFQNETISMVERCFTNKWIFVVHLNITVHVCINISPKISLCHDEILSPSAIG